MNFEGWFSTPIIINQFSSPSTPEKIKDYIRYVVIFIDLRGFTMERSAKDIIFGYDDEFLEIQKNMYPPFGGDPSIQVNIAINDPNITEDQVINNF